MQIAKADIDADRDTGRTTRQMQGAARDAVFIWCNTHLHYPRHLAIYLKRRDLQVVSPDWLSERRWQGRTLSDIVVDHATNLSERQIEELTAARHYAVRKTR